MAEPLKFTDTVKYRALTFLAQELTLLLDSGELDHITVGEATDHIRDGDVFQWLKSLAPAKMQVDLFGSQGPYLQAGIDWIEGLRKLSRLDIRGKWGIETRGLCLLLTLTFELLRHEVDAVTETVRQLAPSEPPPDMH